MRRWSLAHQLLALQLAIITSVIAVVGFVVVRADRSHTTAQQRERVLTLAESLATSGEVLAAARSDDPTAILQPLAERVRTRANVAFVVFMTPDGRRWSHPTPSEIGGRFVGRIAPAQAGRSFTETTTGTLGPSIRAVVPIRRPGGDIDGLVAVGVLQETIADQVERQLPGLLAVLGAALLAGAALSLLVTRRVRRQTHGMDPQELAALYEHHDAVLHSIGEGVVVAGVDGRLLLANAEARRLLDLPEDALGCSVGELVADTRLAAALVGRGDAPEGLHVVGTRVLVAGHRAATQDGRDVGTVSTLRDRTQLEGLVQELATVRGLADALRAQAHEAANELHTVVGLVELGRYDDAISFATRRIGITQGEVDDVQSHIGSPALAALLLAKGSTCRERGVELTVDPRSDLPDGVLPDEALITVIGNLVDNALDALADQRGGHITVLAWRQADGIELQVRDSGPGVPADAVQHVFQTGWSTKTPQGPARRGLGLALVQATAARLGGTAEVITDGGAVFTVRVPARDPAEMTTP
jgi:sensor histidine kinase regulating citrate/malate metabolism